MGIEIGKDVVRTVPPWLDLVDRTRVENIVASLPQYYHNLLAIVLYGSMARAEARPMTDPDPSDIDLLLVFDHCLSIYERHQVNRTRIELDDGLIDGAREISVLYADADLTDWSPDFVKHIETEGIKLFTRNRAITPHSTFSGINETCNLTNR